MRVFSDIKSRLMGFADSVYYKTESQGSPSGDITISRSKRPQAPVAIIIAIVLSAVTLFCAALPAMAIDSTQVTQNVNAEQSNNISQNPSTGNQDPSTSSQDPTREAAPDWISNATNALENTGDRQKILGGGQPGWGDIGKGIVYLLYLGCYTMASTLLDSAGVALEFIDPIALFSVDLNGADWAAFYSTATSIANSVTVYFGDAILIVMFVVELSRITSDPHGSQLGITALGKIFFTYALSYTIVHHAVDLFAFLYWLGQSLVRGVSSAIGGGFTMGAITENMKNAFLGAMNEVTYADWTLGFLYVILALVCFAVCIVTALKILSFAVLRMGEIYLRIAFAGIPVAMSIGERSRQAAIDYLKRFLAVCFSAAVLTASLALVANLFTVVTNLVKPPADPGFTGVLMTVLAPITTLLAINTLIGKADSVSADLFHTHPSH